MEASPIKILIADDEPDILEIIGFDSSTDSIGMKIETLAFGKPNPLFAVTLPTATP